MPAVTSCHIAVVSVIAVCGQRPVDTLPPPASGCGSCRARRADRYRSGMAGRAREETRRVRSMRRPCREAPGLPWNSPIGSSWTSRTWMSSGPGPPDQQVARVAPADKQPDSPLVRHADVARGQPALWGALTTSTAAFRLLEKASAHSAIGSYGPPGPTTRGPSAEPGHRALFAASPVLGARGPRGAADWRDHLGPRRRGRQVLPVTAPSILHRYLCRRREGVPFQLGLRLAAPALMVLRDGREGAGGLYLCPKRYAGEPRLAARGAREISS